MEIFTASKPRMIIMDVCCVCGIEFGLADDVRDAFRRTGKRFRCPNGHRLYFPQAPSPAATAPTAAEVKKLKRQLVQAAHDREQAEAAATHGRQELEAIHPAKAQSEPR